MFVGGYTVFTLSVRLSERTNESVSVTFCFLNICVTKKTVIKLFPLLICFSKNEEALTAHQGKIGLMAHSVLFRTIGVTTQVTVAYTQVIN